MHSRMFVAFSRVAPIDHEHVATRTHVQIDSSKEGIGCEAEIWLVPADESRTVPLQSFHVRPASVHIEREQFPSILLRPLIGQIDRHADVSVTASQFVRLTITAVGPFSRRIKMVVIGDRIHPLINMRILAFPKRLFEMSPRHNMPQMSDDCIDKE